MSLNQTANEFIERLIVTSCIEDLLAVGPVSVNDGEETTLRNSTDIEAIMGAMFTTDEDNLYVDYDGGRRFVYFVHGNGTDIITDYSVALEDVIRRTSILVEKIDAGDINPFDMLIIASNKLAQDKAVLLAALKTAREEIHHPGAYREGCARIGDFSADLTKMLDDAIAQATTNMSVMGALATNRPGDHAAIVADETGMSYADALRFTNTD